MPTASARPAPLRCTYAPSGWSTRISFTIRASSRSVAAASAPLQSTSLPAPSAPLALPPPARTAAAAGLSMAGGSSCTSAKRHTCRSAPRVACWPGVGWQGLALQSKSAQESNQGGFCILPSTRHPGRGCISGTTSFTSHPSHRKGIWAADCNEHPYHTPCPARNLKACTASPTGTVKRARPSPVRGGRPPPGCWSPGPSAAAPVAPSAAAIQPPWQNAPG